MRACIGTVVAFALERSEIIRILVLFQQLAHGSRRLEFFQSMRSIFKWVARVDFAIQSKWTLSPRDAMHRAAREEREGKRRDGITLHQRIHLSWRQPACSLACDIKSGSGGKATTYDYEYIRNKGPPWTKRDGCMNSSSVLIGTKWKDRAVPKSCRYPTCSASEICRTVPHLAAYVCAFRARARAPCSLARSLRSALMTIYSDFVRLPH